ncbi:MAG: ATP-dependent DNA helicase [Gammaproteobacteria bacterium]|nr:ATP-dependent DNA helicase [Gammaproteobacteria bacterium]
MASVFAPDGLLANHIPGFNYRSQQTEMAVLVDQVLNSDDNLVVEAGTGTGKTFAYLAPAIISRRKVVISTGTRNLQDQLFQRDLPLLREALGVPLKAALLKGRANYLCSHRLDLAPFDPRSRSREMTDLLERVRSWSNRTDSGDIAELADIPEQTDLWPLITSTNENCLGQDCPEIKNCHLMEARRRAQEADLVVINHHLLCADFALKAGGFGELLPDADAFVIDEAHQLPEVAGDFFGDSISGRQLTELARDVEAEYQRDIGDTPVLLEKTAALVKRVRDLRLLFGLDSRRGAWKELEADERLQDALTSVHEGLQLLTAGLTKLAGRSKGLDACQERAQELSLSWSRIAGPPTDKDKDEDIRWFETFSQSFRLNRTPLDVAGLFAAAMERHPANWIFTSATLAVGGNFDHFAGRLGLQQPRTALWDSPFDYSSQALWYVPRGLPDPRNNGDAYTRAVVEYAQPVLEASRGRAFLLFTSHRALRLAAELLAVELEFPLFIQGDAPKGELIERFRQSGNGVLLGTSSFWEGVDVKGEALSCVIIDKLPFASPGDPVLQARLDAMKRRNENPFFSYQIPQAAIALKQGAGRLIRDAADRGVLMICDPRLLKRGYGQIFLDSMPNFARTRELADVQRFFAEQNAEENG